MTKGVGQHVTCCLMHQHLELCTGFCCMGCDGGGMVEHTHATLLYPPPHTQNVGTLYAAAPTTHGPQPDIQRPPTNNLISPRSEGGARAPKSAGDMCSKSGAGCPTIVGGITYSPPPHDRTHVGLQGCNISTVPQTRFVVSTTWNGPSGHLDRCTGALGSRNQRAPTSGVQNVSSGSAGGKTVTFSKSILEHLRCQKQVV